MHLLILTLFTATHNGMLTGPEILVSAFQTCPKNNSWKSKESNPLCVEETMLVPICWACDEWARKNTFPGNIENLPGTKMLWTVPPKLTHGPRSLITPRLQNKRTNRTKIAEQLKPWPTAAISLVHFNADPASFLATSLHFWLHALIMACLYFCIFSAVYCALRASRKMKHNHHHQHIPKTN